MAEAASEAPETAEAGETAAVGTPDAQETPPTEAPATNGATNGEAVGEAPAGPEAALPSWRDGIPAELRKSADQFTSPTALLKSYAELRNKFNKSVQPLPESPNDEQLASFRKKAGIPEAPEGYGVKPPEWLDEKGVENFNAFLDVAHQANMAPGQVKATLETWAAFEQARAEADVAAVNGNTEAGVKALKEEWGLDFDANLAVAERALAHFGGADITEALKGLKLEGGGVAASHPAIVKLLAEVGRAASEPTGVHVPLVTSSEGREALEAEADKLMMEPDYYGDPRKLKRVEQIYAQIHGKQPHSGPGVSA